MQPYLEDWFSLGTSVCHWDCEDDSERVELATLLEDFDLVQHVKGPPHEPGHTLDLVITRKEDDLVASCDTRAFISDHNALLVTLTCSRKHPPSKISTYWSMKSVNVPALCHDISSTLSQCPGTLDEAVDQYNTTLKDLIELHAPLKQRSVVDHPNHPWINKHISEKKRER